MALISCRECDTEVRADASFCPECGHAPADRVQPVVLRFIDIGFWNLVGLMLKFAFASIPAAIIFGLVMGVVAAFVMAAFGTL